MSDKIAFLDRDGVINEKAPEHDYIKSWNDFHFKQGAIEGIRLLNTKGFKVVVVTNQRGIARGLMSQDDLENIHIKMCEYLQSNNARIDAIFYCPHEKGTCSCRKPDIGLFLQAEKVFNIEKSQSIMIGDSLSDIEAGENYGVKAYLLASEESLKNLLASLIILA